jgi:hypothetical protein
VAALLLRRLPPEELAEGQQEGIMTITIPHAVIWLAVMAALPLVLPVFEEYLGKRWARVFVFVAAFNFVASCVLGLLQMIEGAL